MIVRDTVPEGEALVFVEAADVAAGGAVAEEAVDLDAVRPDLAEVVDPALKARVLSTLMERWQPEGRYEPIAADHDYAALSPQQLTTTLVSRILSQMNGSGSDPLIAGIAESMLRARAALWAEYLRLHQLACCLIHRLNFCRYNALLDRRL